MQAQNNNFPLIIGLGLLTLTILVAACAVYVPLDGWLSGVGVIVALGLAIPVGFVTEACGDKE